MSDEGFALDGARFQVTGQTGQASGTSEDGSCEWSIAWAPTGGEKFGRPMFLFPFKRMLSGGLPKSKLVTPAPLLQVSGQVRWEDECIEVRDWVGMQGHNWGREHSPEYAWGQAWFGGADPTCIVEGFTARTRVGGFMSPRLSCLVVRTQTREFRFDRFWRLRSHQGTLGDQSWRVSMMNDEARVCLWMDATPSQSVCLRYQNPDGRDLYCFNSKNARVHLWLETHAGLVLSYRATNGALEFLRPQPDARYGAVI